MKKWLLLLCLGCSGERQTFVEGQTWPRFDAEGNYQGCVLHGVDQNSPHDKSISFCECIQTADWYAWSQWADDCLNVYEYYQDGARVAFDGDGSDTPPVEDPCHDKPEVAGRELFPTWEDVPFMGRCAYKFSKWNCTAGCLYDYQDCGTGESIPVAACCDDCELPEWCY